MKYYLGLDVGNEAGYVVMMFVDDQPAVVIASGVYSSNGSIIDRLPDGFLTTILNDSPFMIAIESLDIRQGSGSSARIVKGLARMQGSDIEYVRQKINTDVRYVTMNNSQICEILLIPKNSSKKDRWLKLHTFLDSYHKSNHDKFLEFSEHEKDAAVLAYCARHKNKD